MEYIGKAVKYQHRVATGHATLKPVGSGVRHHVPVPTKLETHDALVLLSYPHDKAEQQRISSEIEARRAAALAQVQNLYDHDRLEADTPEARAKLEEKFKQAKKEIEAAHQKEVAENAEAQAKVPPRVSLLYATGKPMDGRTTKTQLLSRTTFRTEDMKTRQADGSGLERTSRNQRAREPMTKRHRQAQS